MIKETKSNAHWIFFTAIENDTETLLRFIEPTEPNFSTYSLEICRVLFAACSECEIVLKEIARSYGREPERMDIEALRKCIMEKLPDLASEKVFVPRYGLELDPWDNWRAGKSPNWWTGYNKVKHQRLDHYHEGSLINALNSVAALMVATIYYYRLQVGSPDAPAPFQKVLRYHLSPASVLFALHDHRWNPPAS